MLLGGRLHERPLAWGRFRGTPRGVQGTRNALGLVIAVEVAWYRSM